MGSVFEALTQNIMPGPALGIGFGLAVWGGSYLGWIPALGILRPANRHPPRRTSLMIASHMVWGGALGWLLKQARNSVRNGQLNASR